MFHANAWGLVFTCPMVGAAMVNPGPQMDGASIFELLDAEQVSFTAAVPTVWLMLLQHLEELKALGFPQFHSNSSHFSVAEQEPGHLRRGHEETGRLLRGRRAVAGVQPEPLVVPGLMRVPELLHLRALSRNPAMK